jgi:biotin carboxylase
MRVARVSVLVLMVFALVACATFSENAYRSLIVSQQTYDTTLSVLGDLYKSAKLTESQKEKAISIGRAYQSAHNKAVTALLTYETSDKTTEPAAKLAYQQAAAEAAKILAELVAYAAPYITGGK